MFVARWFSLAFCCCCYSSVVVKYGFMVYYLFYSSPYMLLRHECVYVRMRHSAIKWTSICAGFFFIQTISHEYSFGCGFQFITRFCSGIDLILLHIFLLLFSPSLAHLSSSPSSSATTFGNTKVLQIHMGLWRLYRWDTISNIFNQTTNLSSFRVLKLVNIHNSERNRRLINSIHFGLIIFAFGSGTVLWSFDVLLVACCSCYLISDLHANQP